MDGSEIEEVEALKARIHQLESELDQLKNKERRNEAILGHMNFGVVLLELDKANDRFIIRFLNESAARIESLKLEEVQGKALVDVFPHAKDSGLKDLLRHVAADGQPRHHQTRLVNKHGVLSHCHNDYVFPLDSGELVIVYYDSTERSKTEEDLRQFQHAIQQSIDGVAMTDLHGRVIFTNDAMAAMHGCEADELLGRHFSMFYPPEFLENEIESIKHDLQTKGSYTGEVLHVRSDGVQFPTMMTISAVTGLHGAPLGTLAIARDITAEKEAREQLKLLETAVREAGDGITITDADLDSPGPRILFVNNGFTRITGYTMEEAVGKSPRILQGPRTDKEQIAELKKNLEEGKAWEGMNINYRKDGSPFYMEWRISPIHNERGEVTHFVSVQRDVTERENAKAAQKASEQLATILRMAVTYNHEINNPLQAITGFAELLLDEENNPDKRESLESILRCGARIGKVIKRIEELSKPNFIPYLDKGVSMLDIGDTQEP